MQATLLCVHNRVAFCLRLSVEMENSNKFAKCERLSRKSVIERLYAEGRSVAAFPLRAVYLPLEHQEDEPAASVLIAVSKKRFRHAVDRNLVKRRLREAYRLNKHSFVDTLQQKNCRMAVSILYLDKQHHSYSHLQARLKKLLQAIISKEFEQ